MPTLSHLTPVALGALEALNELDRHPVQFVDDPASTILTADLRSATPFLGWGDLQGAAALGHPNTNNKELNKQDKEGARRDTRL